VLFRASHYSITLETELARHNLPFVKYGGLKFVEAAHVKDLMSILRLAENPRDIVAGTRALTLLPGIGPKKAAQLLRMLDEPGADFQAWAQVKPPAKAKELWPVLVRLLWQLFASNDPVPEQIAQTLHFYQPLMEMIHDNPEKRLADLEQLQGLAAKFDDRAQLLADLTIDPPTSETELPRGSRAQDQLVLSTLHSAKGLEWQAVYVLHASDGMIPSERAFTDREAIEEERRMFYVALTRAADWLYVCHPEIYYQRSRGWNSWDDDGHRELTRFLSWTAQEAFDHQQATEFKSPA
jgi:DNA helicase-2/ATP-dependent DNA helicase PcrA